MFNSELLNSIENELIQNNEPTYQKVIPITHYTYDTKKTLDFLIEKYGGFVNRYEDKVIVYITDNSIVDIPEVPRQPEERYASLKFERINSSINQLDERVSLLEEKVELILEEQNKQTKEKNKNIQSYMNYFKSNEDKRKVKSLVDEILNHH